MIAQLATPMAGMLSVTARKRWPGLSDEQIKTKVLTDLGWLADYEQRAWTRRVPGRKLALQIHYDLTLASTLTIAMDCEIEHPRCQHCGRGLNEDGVCECGGGA